MIKPEQTNGKFKCTTCGKFFTIMWGNVCNKCRSTDREYKELVEQIKEICKERNIQL